MYLGATHDVWLIRWGAGSTTEMHDHGGSAGALYVAAGALVEYRPGRQPAEKPRRRRLDPFTYRAMRADHMHRVTNESDAVAASLHVYSPPLTTMQHYDVAAGGVPRATHREGVDLGTLQARWRNHERLTNCSPTPGDRCGASRRTKRSEPSAGDALLVDIRPSELRARDGTIRDALVIDRNVLEWRLDPRGAHRIPQVTASDQVVILFCDEGYASSLAAATLQQLGLRNATDLTGGIQAWIRAGLPVEPSVEPSS